MQKYIKKRTINKLSKLKFPKTGTKTGKSEVVLNNRQKRNGCGQGTRGSSAFIIARNDEVCISSF